MPAPLSYWLFRARSTLRWYGRAATRYDVHSPFLSAFIREVYADRRWYHAFALIDRLRSFWAAQRGCQVPVEAVGAPSKTTSRSSRSAAALVAANAIGHRSGTLLFRLALWRRARHILELGTNAGISTLYLHLADTRATLHTVEGNPAVAALARETFRRAGASDRLHAHTALFQEWLTANLAQLPHQDIIFIDGDHRYQPTLDYVRQLLSRITPASVIVVADIHWSEDMERAWAALQSLDAVTATVDTYHFGLLFFRPELRGQRLTLVPTRYKPWRVGFF